MTDDLTQAKPVFPSLKGAILLMLLGWGVGIAVSPLLHARLGMAGAIAIGNLLSLGLITALGLRLSRISPRAYFSIRPFPPGLLWPLFVMAFSGSVLIAELGNWSERLLPMPDRIRDLFMNFLIAGNSAEWLARIGLLIVLAPITEEFVFRGVFLYGLVHNYGPVRGILMSGICFGVFHLIPWQALGAAFVGILLGIVVYRTGSIFAGMALHAFWNALPLLAFSLIPENALTGYNTLHVPSHIPPSALLLSAAVFYLGLRTFWQQTAQNQ